MKICTNSNCCKYIRQDQRGGLNQNGCEQFMDVDQCIHSKILPIIILKGGIKGQDVRRKVKASDSQIGGDHYKNYPIQPWHFATVNKLNHAQYVILKYIMRYKDKNGLQDLKKIKHVVDLIIEEEYSTEKK